MPVLPRACVNVDAHTRCVRRLAGEAAACVLADCGRNAFSFKIHVRVLRSKEYRFPY